MNDLSQLNKGIEHLHALGPKAVLEFYKEIFLPEDLPYALDVIARFKRLSPATVKAVGGDRIVHPQNVMRAV